MCGSGTTLIAAAQLGRYGIGIDLYEKNIRLTRQCIDQYFHHDQQTLFPDDDSRDLWQPELICSDAAAAVSRLDPESVDYTVFSPPYSNALRTESGGVLTRHKERKERGLATVYGDNPGDLGNCGSDREFFQAMVRVADAICAATAPGRYMSIIIQNYVHTSFRPIAWELAIEVARTTAWELKPEQIWTQAAKNLRIHGHPKTFLTSNHHVYVLNFRKEV